MPKHSYLVTFETERESGLFAGRDEISEKLVETFDTGGDADLTGLGSQGNSNYYVVDTEVEEIDSKDLRKFWKENERRVVAELPGDAELRKQNQALRAEVKNKTEEIHRLLDAQDKREADHKKGATRAFVPAGYKDGSLPQYLPDGEHDRIRFESSHFANTDRAEYVDVSIIEQDGKPMIQFHGSRAFIIHPHSSNLFAIEVGR